MAIPLTLWVTQTSEYAKVGMAVITIQYCRITSKLPATAVVSDSKKVIHLVPKNFHSITLIGEVNNVNPLLSLLLNLIWVLQHSELWRVYSVSFLPSYSLPMQPGTVGILLVGLQAGHCMLILIDMAHALYKR